MKLFSIYSSTQKECGINIFNNHLCESFKIIGASITNLNIYTTDPISLPIDSIILLHYVPSSFSTQISSNKLITLLNSIPNWKLIVIFHGIYKNNESRFYNDTLCKDQYIHLKLISLKAIAIVALSNTVKQNLLTYNFYKNRISDIIIMDHPGLYKISTKSLSDSRYVFVGGISRSKKSYYDFTINYLFNELKLNHINLIVHWSNIGKTDLDQSFSPLNYPLSYGYLNDHEWSEIISNASLILCPYKTKIQSVSGIIAESISANKNILSTRFDYIFEMKNKFSDLITIEDNILIWPKLIVNLVNNYFQSTYNYPTWKWFAKELHTLIIKNKFNIENSSLYERHF